MSAGKHLVAYDDGEQEWAALRYERVDWHPKQEPSQEPLGVAEEEEAKEVRLNRPSCDLLASLRNTASHCQPTSSAFVIAHGMLLGAVPLRDLNSLSPASPGAASNSSCGAL